MIIMKMDWNVKVFYVTITYAKNKDRIEIDERRRITERTFKALLCDPDSSVSYAWT